LKTVADRRRHVAYHNKQYSDKPFIGVNLDDLE